MIESSPVPLEYDTESLEDLDDDEIEDVSLAVYSLSLRSVILM
jgi:hypothetical protein